jgi:hypothetical protein
MMIGWYATLAAEDDGYGHTLAADQTARPPTAAAEVNNDAVE